MPSIGVEGHLAIGKLRDKSLVVNSTGTLKVEGLLVHDLEIGSLVQCTALYAEKKGSSAAVDSAVTEAFLTNLRKLVVK